uniref:Uncharacterized protein n=1 Tax=Arundo donax TaxID=35708 RepID=A0A0A9DZI1_ARUDO
MMLKALPARFLGSPEPGGWRRQIRRISLRPVSAALMTNPAYFENYLEVVWLDSDLLPKLEMGSVLCVEMVGLIAVFLGWGWSTNVEMVFVAVTHLLNLENLQILLVSKILDIQQKRLSD